MSMDIYHSVLRPLVTEKSTHQTTRTTKGHGGSYAFAVPVSANKAEIRDAVEKIYGVKVVDVRTMVRAGKPRRSKFRTVPSEETKKAIVTVDSNSHIDLF